ncbi:fungal protein [Schizosaccharomyces japonicus yFS275]|uniref:Fungal protein n=1 Tax=Schizosaccharomyces japonicus (strain yFS275 / FY16936) TaxID=402676 RepID=B6JV75_SCHJY|nr:fungal protein [Schizosaccharomyces japonicus yFS275]EEB05276.1 fungal protein [Schizosaccharomyces japonicus yFS275]
MWNKLSLTSTLSKWKDTGDDVDPEDTQVSRCLRNYYLEKTGTLPSWLQPPNWNASQTTETARLAKAYHNPNSFNLSSSSSPVSSKHASSSSAHAYSSPSRPPAPSSGLRRAPSTFDDLFESVSARKYAHHSASHTPSTPSSLSSSQRTPLSRPSTRFK